jgi:hypothetical protein
LAVKCKFEWIDEYEHNYVYFSRIQTDWRLRWPTSDEVPVKSNVAEPITPPASKLRPSSTSTNTFCVPEDDSDVEEVSFSKVRFPTAFLPRNFTHPPEPICVIEDDEGSVQGTVHKGRQMNEDPKSSGDPESYYDECYHEDVVLEDQSDDSANSSDEEESELEESDPSSLVDSKDGANANSSHREEAGDYAYDRFSEEDSECDWEASDSNALSGNESSVGNDSYDDEKPYIKGNAFVDPSMLLREELRELREDAFINSVSPSLPVKPEATDPKSSIPVASASFHEGYSSFPGSYQPPHTFLPPPIPAYDVNPWRMPQNFAASSHTPYPRFEYEDGPFSCKNGSVYPRNRIDSNPSTPLREPSPVKEFSPDVASVPLKRKASEMEAQDAQKPGMVVPVSQTDLNGLPKAEVVDAISSALSEGEPSSKRVKSSHSPSRAMAGYTATAVISALLGGLGTIALLAALPAEYFQ